MKSAMMGAQSIALGQSDIVITGGMESMSNIPHYMPGARGGVRLGNASVIDGIVHDGLWDIYNNQHMGMCAEACAEKYNFSRDDQDAYCIESYTRAQNALSGGMFDDEIVSVEIKGRRGAESTFVTTDEEPNATKIEKITGLRTRLSSPPRLRSRCPRPSLMLACRRAMLISTRLMKRFRLWPSRTCTCLTSTTPRSTCMVVPWPSATRSGARVRASWARPSRC
mmetsp:Transcript_100866/g.289532  ORF Transcript_100866/g.289532 Transcript_100866/m.289532 type:complete len:224 (-) Transcript_100866:343-1014(-)